MEINTRKLNNLFHRQNKEGVNIISVVCRQPGAHQTPVFKNKSYNLKIKFCKMLEGYINEANYQYWLSSNIFVRMWLNHQDFMPSGHIKQHPGGLASVNQGTLIRSMLWLSGITFIYCWFVVFFSFLSPLVNENVSDNYCMSRPWMMKGLWRKCLYQLAPHGLVGEQRVEHLIIGQCM